MSPFLRVPLHPLFHLAFSATPPSPARPLFSRSPGTSVGLNPRVGAHAHFMGLSADRPPLLKTCPSLGSTGLLLSLKLLHVGHPGWPHVPAAPLKRWWVPGLGPRPSAPTHLRPRLVPLPTGFPQCLPIDFAFGSRLLDAAESDPEPSCLPHPLSPRKVPLLRQ